MKNFFKIGEGLIDPWPLLHSLQVQPELWNQYPVRTNFERSAHTAVDDILLRYSPFNRGEDYDDKICTEIDVVDFPAWHKLPAAQNFAYGMMTKVLGVHLGRIIISRLLPGGEITEHTDRIYPAEAKFPNKIPPAQYFERYHIVLKSQPGVVFKCGDEEIYMGTGEVWWFNNQLPHSVSNKSGSDRIHMILDIRTAHDNFVPS